jgi:hypothetical protein
LIKWMLVFSRWSICLSIFLSVVGLASCTVQSKQLGLFTSAAKPQQDALDMYRWRVEFGSYQTELLAVTVPGETQFTNSEDDLVVFDGWMVTEVRGLGQPSVISVQGQVGERLTRKDSSQVGSQECEEWRLMQEESHVIHEQYCVGIERYENRIIVNSSGSIIKIEQYLGLEALGKKTAIVLTKL